MNLKRMLKYSILTILILQLSYQNIKAEVINNIEAHVGNKIITSYDIENLDRNTYKKILAIPDVNIRNAQLEQFKSQAIDFLIHQYVIDISAERAGIKVTDEEVDRAIDEISKNNKISKKKLTEMLLKDGLSLEKYRYQIKNQIVNAKIRNQLLIPKIVITKTDIYNMAKEKADEFGLKNRYKLNIITAQTKKDINSIIRDYKKGIPFSELAKSKSLDPSAVNGGDLGWIDVTYSPIEMEKALEDTKEGNITKPFLYNGLWAVCLVNGFKSMYDFDNATEEKLKDAIGEKLFAKVFEDWLKRNQETIVILKANRSKPE